MVDLDRLGNHRDQRLARHPVLLSRRASTSLRRISDPLPLVGAAAVIVS